MWPSQGATGYPCGHNQLVDPADERICRENYPSRGTAFLGEREQDSDFFRITRAGQSGRTGTLDALKDNGRGIRLDM